MKEKCTIPNAGEVSPTFFHPDTDKLVSLNSLKHRHSERLYLPPTRVLSIIRIHVPNRIQDLKKEYDTLKENDPAELQKVVDLTQVRHR